MMGIFWDNKEYIDMIIPKNAGIVMNNHGI